MNEEEEEPTPNPFHLPPKERARCSHVERIMAASGRYSTCSECFKIGVKQGIEKYPEASVQFTNTEGES